MATASEAPAPATATRAEPEGLYEVVDGRIVEKPPMGAFEVEIASILQDWLGPFARSNRLGRAVTEMLFRIDPARGLERRPDLAFVSHGRWPLERRAPRESAWEVVPDLAVEVISPTNSANEVQDKLRDYFKAGVRQVWVVYPLHGLVQVHESPTTLRIFRAEAGDTLDGGDVVPGFRLPLATLFGEGPAE
jgi:Uma2 family endonuclease